MSSPSRQRAARSALIMGLLANPRSDAKPSPLSPPCFDETDGVEVLDMSEDETEEEQSDAVGGACPLTLTKSDEVVTTAFNVRPSTSRLTTTSKRVSRCEGSDLDSEFDDEFDVMVTPLSRQNIPGTEDLETDIQQIVNDIDTGVANAADRLLGLSPRFAWVSDFDSFRAVRKEFSGPSPGPVKAYDTPYDAFTDIWDKDIIELIVQETNRYAQQTIKTERAAGTLKPSSRLHSWTDTNADEIMVLFTMFMYMAIDQRTSLAEYWIQDDVLQLPGFRRLMSYNRYILLNKFLHFLDNTTLTSKQLPQSGENSSVKQSAKLRKLAPIIDHLGKKFKSLYNMGPDICVDESLSLFKGRLSRVQAKMPKAARFVIKSYELCDSATGYMGGFQIYIGKCNITSGEPPLGVNLGEKSTTVVLELLKGLEHRGHCVVMDDFYNCPSLSRYLKSLGFDNYGALRVCRRNVPGDIAEVSKKVSKGTIISRHCGDVSIIAWIDSKIVNIISTYHRPDTYLGTRAGKPLVKPVCVKDYDRFMGGVALRDQKLSMYLLERKQGVKWYMKIFKRLMNVSIHNAFIMYVSSLNRRNKFSISYREFRYALAESLFKRHHSRLSEVNWPVGNLMRLRRDIVHEPEHLKGQSFRKTCMICTRNNVRKVVHTKCVQCDVNLCFVDCWRIWHSAESLPGKDIRRRKSRRRKE